ncbi:hypothetical protein RGQ29_003124 [Quercus rubra]|uniref:Uncharacterized protein n=1 Tax=Quercus rubra TaxID=3512 RepID=A0AAN7EAR8_QUERU|nr:hypothetical protein RGQ29_003124 [Quercus rubra]KAK4567169.1 hypothetical protein RGQ29_003124 [Quercus rubra]
MNLNPDGWQGPSSWRMLYGMDINSKKSLVLVANNFGFLYLEVEGVSFGHIFVAW